MQRVTLPFLQPVTDLVVSALGPQLRPGVSDYLDLFTDDGVLEVPYVPAGAERAWRGKAAIEQYLSGLRGTLEQRSMTLSSRLATDGRAVLEYTGEILRLDLGRSFVQDYVTVIELADGRIRLFREYSNPLRVSEAATGPA